MIIVFLVLWAILAVLGIFMLAAVPSTERASTSDLFYLLVATGVASGVATSVLSSVVRLFS